MPKRVGKYTISLENMPSVNGYGSAVGKKEGEGPLAADFDNIFEDTKLGQKSWEAAESALVTSAITGAVNKAGITNNDINAIFVGDLLDQSIASTFGVKDFCAPHIGLFGACSTMALSLSLASVMVDSGAMDCAVAATSSHFCSAERQFRFPLEYGGKRTPTSQWTVTGAGAAVIQKDGNGPYIKSVTFGKITDFDITDANNMGAAMAPAACDTICNYLNDTGSNPSDFDLILTGDLGEVGGELLCQLMQQKGYDIYANYNDCGKMIYDSSDSDVAAGGSGCGCSGSVLCSHIFKRMQNGELKRILFIGTGALMSPTSSQQGLSIPGVAHLAEIVYKK